MDVARDSHRNLEPSHLVEPLGRSDKDVSINNNRDGPVVVETDTNDGDYFLN